MIFFLSSKIRMTTTMDQNLLWRGIYFYEYFRDMFMNMLHYECMKIDKKSRKIAGV